MMFIIYYNVYICIGYVFIYVYSIDWTIWVVPLKGVKVGVRNVDPARDIEDVKTKIRDHPELNLAGYTLSEFSLHRKGGVDLPAGSLVSTTLVTF